MTRHWQDTLHAAVTAGAQKVTLDDAQTTQLSDLLIQETRETRKAALLLAKLRNVPRWCAGTEQGGSSRPAERASRHMVEWIQQFGGQDDCAGQTGDVLSTNIQKVSNESHVGSRSTSRSGSRSMAASNSHVANIIPMVLVREMRSNILPNTLAEEAETDSVGASPTLATPSRRAKMPWTRCGAG
ncbi:unnamed protein product [Symbiodinium necroappetens]|uniref:Uncharacterized protein n=1 Tax=Symbiodinium necroappetens TaxID=1628268 RepID=A0A812K4W4_9DINO|nr:unnamed protein product [Symbiodinium necroappetens]